MKKHRVKMETDRYEMVFGPDCYWDGEVYHKAVWEAETYVGPGAMNRCHIELIHSEQVNNPILTDGMINARILKNTNQSVSLVKFRP